jgi:hypothetical protein
MHLFVIIFQCVKGFLIIYTRTYLKHSPFLAQFLYTDSRSTANGHYSCQEA